MLKVTLAYIVIILFMICAVISLDYDHTLVLKPFQLANDNKEFHCAAYGVDDSELSLFQSYYCCNSCTFNLHVECAFIPTTLNLKVKYPLHLFFSLPMNCEAASLSCSICTKVVPTLGCWVFYNHDHVYLCHFDRAAIVEFSMETDSLGQLQNQLQTLAITSRPPARANQPSGGVTHFTHRHSLKEYGSANSLRCSLCNFSFMKGYICVGCNYFIDNICFSLYRIFSISLLSIRGNQNYKSRRPLAPPGSFCDHCGYKGHLKTNCYKLVGYPPDFQRKKNLGSAGVPIKPYASSNVAEVEGINNVKGQGRYISEDHYQDLIGRGNFRLIWQ
ncbi:hypothetical protein H5410_061972, partial [Solanum commersonii]